MGDSSVRGCDERANESSSGKEAENCITNVCIWDMDETLILLRSLLNGSFANSFNGSKDVQKGIEIGKMWQDFIIQLCDGFFFYKQMENFDMPYLDAVKGYDDGRDLSDYNFDNDGFGNPNDGENKKKLAYRHRVIANKYKQGLHGALDQEKMSLWDNLYNMTDEYTDKWLSSARAFLEMCAIGKEDLAPLLSTSGGVTGHTNTKFKHINVLVTAGSLIPSLAKCLLFRLDNLIRHENVYSSWEVGKPQCFKWIKERFCDRNVQFCVIGDGWEECEAAQLMRWPFVQIGMQPGSCYRFPGLTLRTLGYYFAVVYGNPGSKNDEGKSSDP